MSETMHNLEEFDTNVGRRIWLDITIGGSVALWGLAGFAALTSHSLGTFALTVASVATVLCALTISARSARTRHQRVMDELARLHAHDQLVVAYVNATSRMLESVARHMPKAVDQVRWKSYTEAAEDLVGATGTVHFLRQPPPARLEESTGDLGPHINGHRN